MREAGSLFFVLQGIFAAPSVFVIWGCFSAWLITNCKVWPAQRIDIHPWFSCKMFTATTMLELLSWTTAKILLAEISNLAMASSTMSEPVCCSYSSMVVRQRPVSSQSLYVHLLWSDRWCQDMPLWKCLSRYQLLGQFCSYFIEEHL